MTKTVEGYDSTSIFDTNFKQVKDNTSTNIAYFTIRPLDENENYDVSYTIDLSEYENNYILKDDVSKSSVTNPHTFMFENSYDMYKHKDSSNYRFYKISNSSDNYTLTVLRGGGGGGAAGAAAAEAQQLAAEADELEVVRRLPLEVVRRRSST